MLAEKEKDEYQKAEFNTNHSHETGFKILRFLWFNYLHINSYILRLISFQLFSPFVSVSNKTSLSYNLFTFILNSYFPAYARGRCVSINPL